jgi:hypothetical protein
MAKKAKKTTTKKKPVKASKSKKKPMKKGCGTCG